MNKKSVYLILAIGGGIGCYFPVLFGVDGLSAWTLLGGTIGTIAAIIVVIKLNF